MMMYINALKLWWNRTQPPIRRKRTPKPSSDLPCYWCCLCIAVGFPFLNGCARFHSTFTTRFRQRMCLRTYLVPKYIYRHAWLGSAACIGYVLFWLCMCMCACVCAERGQEKKRDLSHALLLFILLLLLLLLFVHYTRTLVLYNKGQHVAAHRSILVSAGLKSNSVVFQRWFS